jgi:hypothetical protein
MHIRNHNECLKFFVLSVTNIQASLALVVMQRHPAIDGSQKGMATKVKHYSATFKIDYGLLYWNSRLDHDLLCLNQV